MSLLIKIIIFIIATIGFVWLSWSSFCNLRSHGFYRFFAFEAIAILILFNIDYWLYEPFSIRQIISWILLIISIFMVIHGSLLLHKMGKPDSKRDEPTLIGIEKTTHLVTVGAYRYIRHPIYSSGIYGVWGVFLKNPTWNTFILVLIATFFFTMTAKMEEAENIRYFGRVYQDYMKQTNMFIPFLF